MYDLINIFKSLPHNDFFVKRYFSFLESCRKRTSVGYKENHHILPKCIWKDYRNLSKNSWNKIRLSSREHYIAHFILAKCFTGTEKYKMILALDAMRLKNGYTNSRYFNSRLYSKLKEELRIQQSLNNKGNKNPNYGKPRSEETKRKISMTEKGKTVSEESRKKMSVAKKGKPLPDCHKEAISNSLKGRIVTEETRQKLSKSQYGSKGSNAKTFDIISPRGVEYRVTGGIKRFCVQHNLSYTRIKTFINNGPIPPTDETSPNVTSASINCAGWIFKRL